MTFCPADEELNQVHQAVLKAVSAGAKLSEIAVLVGTLAVKTTVFSPTGV